MMMFGHGGHWGIWQVGFMGIVMIAVLGLLLWATYVLVGYANRGSNRQDREDHPRRSLYQRLGDGEIDEDEYRRLCDLLADENRTSAGGRRQGSGGFPRSPEED
jgi:uncharacterized membrane protein